MTTEEFKAAHPELAHLEGNDLWNAMEDSMLSKSSKGHRTLEDVLEDEKNHPDDWEISKHDIPGLGMTTFHFKKDFINQFKDDTPHKPMSMCIMMPSGGLLDANGNNVQASHWYRPGFWAKYGRMERRSREYFRKKAYYAAHPFAKRGDYKKMGKKIEVKYISPRNPVPTIEFWEPKSQAKLSKLVNGMIAKDRNMRLYLGADYNPTPEMHYQMACDLCVELGLDISEADYLKPKE